MLLVFQLRREKSFPFVVMIKKEAGNRGVVCRRSGFCHGEVSNTDCLFVVVGFEAHTLGAFTSFSCSAASLCFGSTFRVVSLDFFRDSALWLSCLVAFPGVNIYTNL